jgi:hypothetical protein
MTCLREVFRLTLAWFIHEENSSHRALIDRLQDVLLLVAGRNNMHSYKILAQLETGGRNGHANTSAGVFFQIDCELPYAHLRTPSIPTTVISLR